MNIDLSGMEKEAGAVGSTLKYVAKHPWQILVPVVTVGGVLSLANKVHPAHQMFREETKRSAMKEQGNTLKEILQEVQKSNEKDSPEKSNIAIQPLA